jgi:hypothetical protein
MYQLLPDTLLGPAQCIKRLSDNAFIPFDPANVDFQEYQRWLSAGNQPLSADAPLPSDADAEGHTPEPADAANSANTQE